MWEILPDKELLFDDDDELNESSLRRQQLLEAFLRALYFQYIKELANKYLTKNKIPIENKDEVVRTMYSQFPFDTYLSILQKNSALVLTVFLKANGYVSRLKDKGYSEKMIAEKELVEEAVLFIDKNLVRPRT